MTDYIVYLCRGCGNHSTEISLTQGGGSGTFEIICEKCSQDLEMIADDVDETPGE